MHNCFWIFWAKVIFKKKRETWWGWYWADMAGFLKVMKWFEKGELFISKEKCQGFANFMGITKNRTAVISHFYWLLWIILIPKPSHIFEILNKISVPIKENEMEERAGVYKYQMCEDSHGSCLHQWKVGVPSTDKLNLFKNSEAHF